MPPKVSIVIKAIVDAIISHTAKLTDTLQMCGGHQKLFGVVAQGLPPKAASDLHHAMMQFTPSHMALSDIHPRDCTTFWRSCERTLLDLGAYQELDCSKRAHIISSAHHLLS